MSFPRKWESSNYLIKFAMILDSRLHGNDKLDSILGGTMIVKRSSITLIRKYFISFLFLPILFIIFCSQAGSENLDFKLYDIYGREVRSSDYLGISVFFEFGACW
jgi:hypothetical protein